MKQFSIEQQFLAALREGGLPKLAPTELPAELTSAILVELFESQVLSRHCDLTSRRLQAEGKSYYTIGSMGHEGNAAVAAALRPTDPAFLHYRSGGFFFQRSRQLCGSTPVRDVMLSFAASSDDPISGGRHKVWGSKRLNIPPQTSTIASHLPKAVGAAYSLGLWKRLHGQGEWAPDSVVLCSFGDASFNHSTAQGAMNTAAWVAYLGVPLPLVFVCEDNGIGISVPTPRGWIAHANGDRLHRIEANGLDLVDTYRAANEAVRHARIQHKPVLLHLSMVRLLGHAGSDAEQAYLSSKQIAENEARDPLLYSAARLIDLDILSANEILELYAECGDRVARVAAAATTRPKLVLAEQVKATLVPPARAPSARPDLDLVVDDEPRTMARLLNTTLDRLLARHPNLVLAGEDVGRKGGVYGVTQRLGQRHGAHRVIDTLLDEQSILGLGIGLAHNRVLPIVEIQFLAYLHNAEDQLRGEAATLPFFSRGQFTNPMVVRIAGLGYQKGFGGHFHNDNAIAVLRDIPGLLVACPSDGAEAVALLQEAVRLADVEQRVVVVIEPIALYHERDLLAADDGLWLRSDPGPEARIPVGELAVHGHGTDIALISYGNGARLCHRAAAALVAEGFAPRIVQLRWLTGIDHDAVFDAVADCERVLIVDECRRSGSPSEELLSNLFERGRSRVARHTAEDCFIALGPAATATLPSVDSIVSAARELRDGT